MVRPKQRRWTKDLVLAIFAFSFFLISAASIVAYFSLSIKQKGLPHDASNKDVVLEAKAAPVELKDHKEQAPKALATEMQHAIEGLLGIKQPSVVSMHFFSSGYFAYSRYDSGTEVMIEIDNPTPNAIESIRFVLQNRNEGRTVANVKGEVGGRVTGGVERKSRDKVVVFVSDDRFDLTPRESGKLAAGEMIEVAIQKIEYANGTTLDLSDKLEFVPGKHNPEAEEDLASARRIEMESRFNEMLDRFMNRRKD